jgi:hypothetical protein
MNMHSDSTVCTLVDAAASEIEEFGGHRVEVHG